MASLPLDPGLKVMSMVEVLQSSLLELPGKEACQEIWPKEKLAEYVVRKMFLALKQMLLELQVERP